MAKLPERDLETLWNRLKDVYEYFKSRGIPDKIIAGILGNAGREGSGFWDNVTNSIKDKEGKIQYFYGGVLNELATYDWVNTNYGGYTKQHQIQYIADGVLGKLPEIKSDRGRLLNSRFRRFMSKASKSNSPSEIAAYWESIYEIAGKSKLDERLQCAEYFYKLMQKSNSKTKPSNKLNKSKSLPDWASPDFSKVALSIKNPYYDFTSENTELDYPAYNLDNVKTEFDLPVYASNFKRGGKLIKKGQQGVKLHKTIYLKKDGNEPESPHSELKSWITGITPEERMDLTVQELSNGLSTYQPTKEQKRASEGIYHPKRITDWLGLVPVVLPAAITAGVTLPEWGPTAIVTASNPAFWGELIKDTGIYIAADATSQGLTGKGVGAHVNNAIGLEEEHPVGEFIGFGGTSILRRPIQLMGKTAYQSIRGTILPEYALSLAMDKAADASTRILSQQEIEEKAKILTLQLLNLLKTVGDNTVLIYTDEEANDVKRLLSVLNLHPEYGADGSFKFIGQINRKTPFDEALVNLYKYRIKNNFTPTQETISLPNYIINTPNGLDFVNATHNVDKYVMSLTDLPIFATVQKNYRPGVAGIRKTTDIGRAHTQIYKVEDPLDAKTTIIHENIGHGMNPLAPYYLSTIFGNKTMYNVYEDLANNIWNPTAAKVQFREFPLPPEDIQAEVANINQFILKKVAKAYNLSDEQVLELSKNNISLLDLMFKNEVDKLSKEELEAMLNALGSRYGRQLIRFLPGPHGLAAQDLFFNLMSRPETPSNELFLYDSLKQLRELNSLYTQEQANNYLNNFKKILKYGFSVAGIGAVTTDK